MSEHDGPVGEDDSAASHGVTGGTERGDSRMEEEPAVDDEGGTADWAEKTDRGGEATS